MIVRGRAHGYDPFVVTGPWVTIGPKYVNMTDINFPVATDRPPAAAGERLARGSEPMWDVIELLFFAYRDFISDPDDVLAKFGFGDRKSTRLNSSHSAKSRMPSSA